MTQKNLSPFGEAAVALDHGFSELEELGGQLERLTLESENGLERARSILVKFSASGQRVSEGLHTLATRLNEARSRAEKTAEMVSARAAQIQERQRETESLVGRFGALGESVKKVAGEVSALQKPSGNELSDAEKGRLIEHLPQLDSQLAALSSDARQLKEEARKAKMKGLESNADALAQTLHAMRGRLSGFRDLPRATLH